MTHWIKATFLSLFLITIKKTNMNIFEKQQKHEEYVDSNYFDLSHTHKSSMQFGKLYPVLCEETLPGDHWNMETSKMARALPMVSPMMHRVTIEERWFYVPNRIIWKGWEEFITVRQEDMERIVPTTFAHITSFIPVGFNLNQVLGRYMGLPAPTSPSGNGPQVSALPLAGYVAIWNTYYRNTQVTAAIDFELKDGLNIYPTDIPYTYGLTPLPVLWSRGYFTSALPSPTLGINVPIAASDDVYLRPGTLPNVTRDALTRNLFVGGGALTANNPLSSTSTGATMVIDPNGQWAVNVGTIEMLKSAFALQAYLEKEVKAGGLYRDNIKAHWNEEIEDYRVALPEYIGSSYQNLVVSEVLSTTDNSVIGAPLGEMAGHGISTSTSRKHSYRTREHGWIYCLISIVPDFVLVSQGVQKKWLRTLREDYPNPAFANLGDQAILNQEINYTHNSPYGVWGYVPKYSEMKHIESRVSGLMATELSYWHLAQVVPNNAALNTSFLYVDQAVWDLDRIFAVQQLPEGPTLDYFVLDVYFDLNVKRKLPRYRLPTTLLH